MIKNPKKGFLGDSSGFTLIELMISLIIGSLILYGLYKTYIFQDMVLNREGGKIDATQNGRNTVDVLTRDLRMIGTGVPETVDDVLTAADYQSITYLANSWNISTRLSSRAVSGDTTLTVEDSSGFIKDQVIYICADDSASAAITLDSDPPNSTTINLPAALTGTYPTGCRVNVVDTVTYAFAGAPKEIQRTILPQNALNAGVAETLATDIDYVQFVYYDGYGAPISALGSTLSTSERASVRGIELTVVALSSKEDNPPSTVTYDDGSSKTDGYTRVYLESDIKLRNMY
ncbi:hypothetical protein UR09_02940 [Candidatus Nitromaritima sp. SCGC AAA799-A02]|nr:hypothetical protein UR09_02940 [Candidatus Nitromaritima sp. SCGC AAA799-A02]